MKILTLNDLKLINAALDSAFDLTTNHEEEFILNGDIEKSGKYPFSNGYLGLRTRAVGIVQVYRKIASIIRELKKASNDFSNVPICRSEEALVCMALEDFTK